jgi:3-oxoacyl-(acyl-carrier-protein) synthase
MNTPEWLLAVYKFANVDYPKFYKMDNLSKLGWLAAEILMMNGFHEKYKSEDVGIVLSNRSSSLDTDIKYFETTKAVASPALFVYTLPNIVIGEISIRHRLKGENAMFVSECFEAGFTRQYVQDLFSVGAVQSCICGWVEFLGNNAEAALFMVEKNENNAPVQFTEENINKLYQLTNG